MTVQIALTDWFDLLDAGVPAVNRGISTERIEGLIERLPEIARLHPATLVLMTGVNDLIAGVSPAEFAARYDRLLGKAQALTPETHLIVNSLLPVNFTLNKQLRVAAARSAGGESPARTDCGSPGRLLHRSSDLFWGLRFRSAPGFDV